MSQSIIDRVNSSAVTPGSTRSGSPLSFVDIPSSDPPSPVSFPAPALHPYEPTSVISCIQVYAPPPREDLFSSASIENPGHPVYRRLKEDAVRKEADMKMLERELKGERVVPVDGAGVWAYSGHKSASEETSKEKAWVAHTSYEAWLKSARARTAYYAQPGVVRPAVRWVLVELEQGDDIPEGALQTGVEDGGAALYSARAWLEGGVHMGKTWRKSAAPSFPVPSLNENQQQAEPVVLATIPFGSRELTVTTFEVLIGDRYSAVWLSIPKGERFVVPPFSNIASGSPSLATNLTNYFQPIEGGREANGGCLMVAQAEHAKGWHPGKVQVRAAHCYIGYGCEELMVDEFRVLVWAF